MGNVYVEVALDWIGILKYMQMGLLILGSPNAFFFYRQQKIIFIKNIKEVQKRMSSPTKKSENKQNKNEENCS